MRIAHTVEFYWPKIGGAERVVQRVAEELAYRGHEAVVLTSAQPGCPATEVHNGVEIRRFGISGNEVKRIRGDVDPFVAEITEGGYEVVFNYAAQSWPTDLTLRHLDDIPGAKVLAPCGYSGLVGSTAQRLLYRSYFRRLPRLLARYDALVYHSAHYVDFEAGQRWGLTNGVVIPNGIDLEEFTARPWEERREVAMTIGNHYRAKGHSDFFRLARNLRGKVEFALAAVPEAQGYKTCIEECSRLAADLGVEMIDGRDRSHVVDVLGTAKVLAITSKIECSPLTALEAMASGTVFVAFDVGCLHDYPGGVIVSNVDEMTAAIEELTSDRDRWSELSERGRDYVMDVDWSAVATKYEDLYRSLLSRRSPVAR